MKLPFLSRLPIRGLFLLACLGLMLLAACRPAPSAPPLQQTTITALIWAPDWPEEMLRIAAEFDKLNPDARVNVQFMIGNSVEQNIKPRVASGNLPDLMSVNPNPYTAALANQGVLVDLGASAAWHNMLDNLKGDWSSSNNIHFGIPSGVATTLIYFNQSMFAQAGIRRLPGNFSEFLQVCQQLRRAGFTPMILDGGFPNMLGNGPFSSGFANNVVALQPAWKQKMADGSLNLDTAQTADIFGKMQLLVRRGYVQNDYMETDYDDGIRLFNQGQAAMTFQGSWAAGLLMHNPGFHTGVLIPPWNPPGKIVVPVIGSETGLAVCNTAKQNVARRFLEFMLGRGFSIMQNKRRNISPFKFNQGPVLVDPQLLAYTRTVAAFPRTSSLYYTYLPANTIDQLHPLLQDVLRGRITAAQAARLLDASIKQQAEMNYK